MPATLTELDVQALVDSHLNWEEEKRVREGLLHDAALHAYYTEIVAQKKLLVAWWNSEKEKMGREASLH